MPVVRLGGLAPARPIILGIRIRSEGLAQVMTKRNASEYIIGSTVEPLLADTLNSGHLPYNGQRAMYQLLSPIKLYVKNLRIADTS